MLANVAETPRPRPPAKMRYRSIATLKTSTSTPPPAYCEPPPEDHHHQRHHDGQPPLPDTLLGSPMSTTFKLVGWNGDRSQNIGSERQSQLHYLHDDLRPLEAAEEEDDEWVSEKSREELADLLVKAEDIIKDRENELGLTSAVCKDLYENNVALKTKHEALLARLSISPCQSMSSPHSMPYVPSRNNSLSYSASDSILHGATVLPPPFFRSHARKVSIATADISLLADQNAELMQKLEQLESESISSDQTGRRELKRLEKEIAMLREALEKTQAKSEELEEKTKGFDDGIDKVVEDAWKRKKEREERFKALRNTGHNKDDDGDDSAIRNFAPEGSTFGGPTATYSLFPTHSDKFDTRSSFSLNDIVEYAREDGGSVANRKSMSQHALISQLLKKVQELEETNSRILIQQAETATQLQSVQRDTEHITKVYECLADPQTVELELQSEGSEQIQEKQPPTNAIKFGSFKRRIESQLPDLKLINNTHTSSKARKSVVGLFDELNDQDSQESTSLPQPRGLPVPFPSSPWSETRHRSSWSFGDSGLASPALSSLSFFNSPQSQFLSELSPVGSRQTLESELGGHFKGESWGSHRGSYHLRTHSLSNLSSFSVPASPSPPPSSTFPEHIGGPPMRPSRPTTTMSMVNGGLRLEIEPPTPEKNRIDIATREIKGSPRNQYISQRLHARRGRWEDGRFGSFSATSSPAWPTRTQDSDLDPPMSMPHRISTAVDNLVDQFDGVSTWTSSPQSDYDEDDDFEDDDNDNTLTRGPQAKAIRGREAQDMQDSGNGKWGSVLLELWLWLQFTIIIFVFLCAMAKRGPKAVLTDAERKRGIPSASTKMR